MFKEFVFIFILSLSFSSIKQGESLECIVCEWNLDNRTQNQDCFRVTDSSISNLDTLECNQTVPFCKTEFTFIDDVVVNIVRNCTNGTEDWDQTSTEMSDYEKCVTNFNPDNTTCYLGCKDSQCNNENFQELNDIKPCGNPCGPKGKCNYTLGVCQCEDGYAGYNCSISTEPIPLRSCIQCDSETMANCRMFNESSLCPELNHRYCAVVSVTRYDNDGNILRDFLSRSCSETYEVADECFISNAAESGGNEVEYTCVATCDVDDCNFGIPNGKYDDGSGQEIQPIRCVVCDSDSDVKCANKNTTEVCPSDSTHCVSNMTYYLSEKTDLRYAAVPDYELESVVRGCSTHFVETSCDKTPVGDSSLIKVTCTESCTIDGCNTGWPARPKCSQCSCTHCTLENDCNSNPPMPVDCPFPYEEYCTIQDVDRYVDLDGYNHGYPRKLMRSCSYAGIGNTVQKTTFGPDNVPLENINVSCTEDGCNLGYYPFIQSNAATSFLPSFSNLLLVLSAVLVNTFKFL